MKNIKKSIVAVALASVALSAFAQEAQEPAPEAENLSIGAKVAYESTYVYRGVEASGNNVQTTVSAEYSFAPTGSLGWSAYCELFYMAPIEREANKFSVKIGGFAMYEDEYFIDFGYKYTSYPNHGKVSRNAVDYSTVNRDNEIFIGIGRDIEFVQDAEWSVIRLFGYATYNFQFESLILECGVEKTFNDIFYVDGLGLKAQVMYGYINQNEADGDQGYRPNNWHDDYGYFSGSLDLIYSLTKNTDVSVGIRYAWNNNGNPRHLSGLDTSNLWVGIGLNFRY